MSHTCRRGTCATRLEPIEELDLRERYSKRCGVNEEAGSEFRDEVRTRASSRGGSAHFAPRVNQIFSFTHKKVR